MAAPSTAVIRYRGRFTFAESPPAVWSALEDVQQFERWFGCLGQFHIEGDGLQAGSVVVGTVSPPLPYRIQLRLELERCVPEQLIDAKVHGDLEGDGHLRLSPWGTGTEAHMAWTIEMMQQSMRAAARVAYPVLRWGHDRVIEITLNEFRSRLQAVSDPPEV
jgi:carbon monoxide dehydrogenase subunit G